MEKAKSFRDILAKVEEPQFWTYHWILEVPQEIYEEVLGSYQGNLYSEEAVQEFVTQYLRWRGDKGIVGLVGLEERSGQVLIDAAVRYPQKRS